MMHLQPQPSQPPPQPSPPPRAPLEPSEGQFAADYGADAGFTVSLRKEITFAGVATSLPGERRGIAATSLAAHLIPIAGGFAADERAGVFPPPGLGAQFSDHAPSDDAEGLGRSRRPTRFDLLRFISGYQQASGGVSPSFAEMEVVVRSRSSLTAMLDHLEADRFIRRLSNRNRAIDILRRPSIPQAPDGAPLYFVAAPHGGVSPFHGEAR